MKLIDQIAQILKDRRFNYEDFNASDGTCEALASWIMDVIPTEIKERCA